jgi:hypothetical protein
MRLRFSFLYSAPLCIVGFALQSATAAAQEPAPAPAPAPGAPATTEAPAPQGVVAPGPVEVLTPPPEAPPPAPPPESAPPPADDPGPLKLGAWARVDVVLSNGATAAPGNYPSGASTDDTFSTGEFEFHASGKVWKFVSLTLNLVASYSPEITSAVSIMDGIVQIEPSPYFNIWLGRHLVPVDRANFAGPYFMSPWYYPGFGFPGDVGFSATPIEGPYGRNDGVTVWGQVEGGMFKYFLGVFDLQDPGASPLYSGRLSISLLNPEPGFWGTATYHGMDLFSVGVGAQFKNDASVEFDAAGDPTGNVDDYAEINADVLFEKNLGEAGVLDLEGGFYKFMGDFAVTDASYYALASYILPGDLGGGKLQPLVRLQQALSNVDGAPDSTLVDAQVNYIVHSYGTRFSLGYRWGKADEEKLSALFFGVQVQK